MNVYLSGSNGLLGTDLRKSLESDGNQVIPLGRSFSDAMEFEPSDVVIHLAGESIAEGRWNQAKKTRIRNSRVEGTKALSERVARASAKPAAFICASAIGYYGNRSDELLTEESEKGAGFLSDVCDEWEKATSSARDAGTRVVHLRTGIVLSEKGGALAKMLLPFKMGAGGVIGTGRQYMSWIALTDLTNSIRFIMDTPSLSGPINLTAPNPVTNQEFTKTLGSVLRRPTIAPMPAFAARLVFGEMADALLLGSARVAPTKLLEAGYQFEYEELLNALKDILS